VKSNNLQEMCAIYNEFANTVNNTGTLAAPFDGNKPGWLSNGITPLKVAIEKQNEAGKGSKSFKPCKLTQIR